MPSCNTKDFLWGIATPNLRLQVQMAPVPFYRKWAQRVQKRQKCGEKGERLVCPAIQEPIARAIRHQVKRPFAEEVEGRLRVGEDDLGHSGVGGGG